MRRVIPGAETLASVLVLVLVAAVFLNVSAKNPPGFTRDEAAIAYNAYTLSATGKDEYGARLPLFIRSFNDYKSPLYVYLLAAVFRVTGPSTAVARTVSAVLGLATILVIYLLALAISRRRWIALAVILLAGLTPWLFETSRVVFEVALMPLVLALLLYVVYRASAGTWRVRHSVAIGLLLAVLAYTYQVGRVLAPLLALGLALCWLRKWRLIAVVWVVFLVAAVVPIGIWAHAHPGALTARYYGSTWITPGMSKSAIVVKYLRQYANQQDLWALATRGGDDTQDHVQGAGSLFFVEVALAIGGIVVVLMRRRREPWWWFMLYAVVISPVAASVVADPLNTRRSVLLALVFPLLAIPALETIAALPVRKSRAAFAGLLIVFVVEAVHWQIVYRQEGPKRLGTFDEPERTLIQTDLRQNAKLYAFREDHNAYIQMLLAGALAGRSPSSTVALDFGERPPVGAHVLLGIVSCPQCPPVIAEGHDPTEEYVYKPARPGVVRTSFQFTSPLRPVGQPADFTVWVHNYGDQAADHLMLRVRLPRTMHLTGPPFFQMGYGCTETPTIVCNIGYFPGHTVTVIRYEVLIDRGGPQTMRASISTDKLEINTGPKSASAFTIDLSPPAYARALPTSR